MSDPSEKTLTFKLVDVIIEIGISLIIFAPLMSTGLSSMAAQSTTGWGSMDILIWGFMGMICEAAFVIAVIAHAKNAGKW